MGGGPDRKDRVGHRLGEGGVVPDDDAALRSAEGLARRTGHDRRAVAQGVLVVARRHQPQLMRAVEEQPPIPFLKDFAHLLDRKGKQRHGQAERHQLRPDQGRGRAEGVEVDLELHRVHGHVDDLEAARARGPIRPVAGMAADRLGDRHDHVARLRQRLIDHGVADHRGAHAVVGVVRLEQLLQQFDAERLQLVDMPGAGEPAVDRADMALGGAGADLAGEQRPDRGTGRGLRRQEVDAVAAAPLGVARHGRHHLAAHGLEGLAGREHVAGPGKRPGIVRLDGVGGVVLGHGGLLVRFGQARSLTRLFGTSQQFGVSPNRRVEGSHQIQVPCSGASRNSLRAFRIAYF